MEAPAEQIIAALKASGPQTTRQLSESVGVDAPRVRRECQMLEKAGLVTSEVRKQLFYPMTREVVTRDNYERVEELENELQEVIEEHDLPEGRDQLVKALEDHFDQLCRRGDLKEFIGAIRDFEEELLKVARRAVERDDLYLRLGTKRLGPRWKLVT